MDNTSNNTVGEALQLRFRLDKTVKNGKLVSQRICNLNCIWCHHDFLDHTVCQKPAITNQQFVDGIQQVIAWTNIPRATIRISGDGEPTMTGQKELVDLVRKLRSIPEVDAIKLTTNGVLLGSMAEALIDAGLTSVTISLNSLDPDIYFFYARVGYLKQVLASIKQCLQAGIKTKVNVVYSRLNAREYPSWITFASQHPNLVIKVFDLLKSDDLSKRLYIPLDRFEKQLEPEAYEVLELENAYYSKEYHLKYGGTIQVKEAQRNNCPNLSCPARGRCLEGCRSSIRIRADGVMQPCGVRTDNSVNLFAKDCTSENVIFALRSGGKLM